MINKSKKNLDFVFIDIVCFFMSFIFSYYVRHKNLDFIYISLYKEMAIVFIIFEVILVYFCNPNINILRNGYLELLKKTFIFDSLMLVLSTTYLFVIKSGNEYSRIVLFLTFLLYLLSSYFIKCIRKKYLQEKILCDNSKKKSIFIICENDSLNEIINNMSEVNYEYFISGICVVDKDLIGIKIGNINIRCNLDSILDYISKNWIDEIFIMCDSTKIPMEIIDNINTAAIPIRFAINSIYNNYGKKQIVERFEKYNTIIMVNNEYKEFDLLIKRFFDICGSIVGLCFMLLIMVIIAPVIYIKSPGPIFYVSNRVGKNGKIFRFYKFRSMIIDAEERKKELEKVNRNKDGMMFKVENDPRIIPGIGKFIRRTSLDEFPQFWNVLKGDMSLVGTRPPTLDEWNKYTPFFRSRLAIKPGITGLWQTSGRSNITDFNEVVKLDNEYINSWSLWLDFKILCKTVLQIFYSNNNESM